MKKALPLVALGLCLVLLAAIVFGIVWFVKSLKEKEAENDPEPVTVEEYFEKVWPEFCPVYYEEDTGTVMLQKQIDCTYEQACSFGKEVYEDMALGHVDTMELMLTACNATCDVSLTDIVVSGVSTDGKVIYTVHADGAMSACWENTEN